MSATANEFRDQHQSQPLYENALFRDMAPEAIDELTRALPRLSLAAGEILFLEGSYGDELYLVLDGVIQIYSTGELEDVTITTFLPGAYFGELALLGASIRSASARAIEDSVLLPVERSTFARMTQDFPIIFSNVNRALAERLIATTRALVDVERGELTLIAVDGLAGWKQIVAYLWEAVAAIGPGRIAVLAPSRLLDHAVSVTSAIRANERPAPPIDGSQPAFFGYRGGSLIEARAATGAIGAMADYFRRWWPRTLVFVGEEEREWVTEALPWIDRLFVVAPPGEFASWRLPDAPATRRTRIEAVPVIASAQQQASAAALARQAGYETPRVYLPELEALDIQTRAGFQISQLRETALPAQRGILRLARAAAGARVGLVLGAGGARGLAHIGVVRYLEELGVAVDAIAGSSMGALVGAGLAQGLDSHGAEELMRQGLASRIRRLMRPTLSRRSIFSPKGLEEICRWLYGRATFVEMATPLAIVATDLVTGRGVALRAGSVARAVRASVTIPGIFPPLLAGPYILIDGGVCDPVPTSALAGLGADITISVNISVTPDDMERWAREEGVGVTRRSIRSGTLPNMLDTYMATINIAVAERAQASSSAAHVAIRPRFRSASWREFADGPEHLRRGYVAATEARALLTQVIPWLSPDE